MLGGSVAKNGRFVAKTDRLSYPSHTGSLLSPNPIHRTDSHSIKFVGKDMIEVSKFLEFIMTYSPSLEP